MEDLIRVLEWQKEQDRIEKEGVTKDYFKYFDDGLTDEQVSKKMAVKLAQVAQYRRLYNNKRFKKSITRNNIEKARTMKELRKLELLELYKQGKSNSHIKHKLCVSDSTVNNYLSELRKEGKI